jgi:uncharacterized membrane protein YeiH
MPGWHHERRSDSRTTHGGPPSGGARSPGYVCLRTQRRSSRCQEQTRFVRPDGARLRGGNAGGITRDLLIGSVPPAAISDWRYLGVSLLAGLVTFFWYPDIDVRRRPVLLFDGAGLALFAVTGTEKALAAGLNPVMAALVGMLTGIGGGMLRDVLVNQTPTVLRADLYAVAALAAGVLVVAGHFMHYPSFAVMIVGALLCFWLTVMAILRGWHLPIAGTPPPPD